MSRDESKDWETIKIKICELKEFEANPRFINKPEFEKLVKGIKQDGYHTTIKVNHEYKMIGGHQRRKALLAAGYMPHDLIEVKIPKRVLTDDEFRRINIRDNLQYGEYDYDILANEYEIEKLVEWGMNLKAFPDVMPPELEKEEEPKETKFKEYCPTCGQEMKESV